MPLVRQYNVRFTAFGAPFIAKVLYNGNSIHFYLINAIIEPLAKNCTRKQSFPIKIFENFSQNIRRNKVHCDRKHERSRSNEIEKVILCFLFFLGLKKINT